MALFDKIFTRKKVIVSESRDWGRNSQITPEQVRLLLFKECDWRGRKLLFDSSTIDRVPSNKNDKPNISQKSDGPCILEVSEGNTYIYKGPSEDASVLGEMIFGAVAMTCKGVSFKIHIMEEPRRIMCTKVFCVPSARRIKRVERATSDVASNIELTASKPVNVPSKEEMSLSFSIDKGDSGFYGDFSPASSVSSTLDYISMLDMKDKNSSQEEIFTFKTPSGRKLSTSSNGSWQRRAFRSVATRFDLSNANSKSCSNLLNVPSYASTFTSCDTQIYSNSSTSGTNDSFISGTSVVTQRKNKLGLALLLTVSNSDEMNLVQKCLEHNPQLHALVSRVRLAVLSAGAGAGDGFVATLYKANRNAAMWLTDLIYSPRVPPMWLTLVTSDQIQVANKMAETLVADLCSVLAVGDNKNTNFFISTLLTHVLTYHLGWVTTVSPYDILDPEKYPQVSTQKRPYNALWAQLNDLCGSIGFPPRAAKTIITGTSDPQFINRLLVVLTYFFRCGDVKRTDIKPQDLVFSASEKYTLIVPSNTALRRTVTHPVKLEDLSLSVEESSSSTLVSSEVNLRKIATKVSLSQTLSNLELDVNVNEGASSGCSVPKLVTFDDNSSDNSSISEEKEQEKQVVFVLGENEKLVGIKNKSNDGKRVKRSSKIHNEPVNLEQESTAEVTKENNNNEVSRDSESPSKCCGQTLEHSKPIKHSGFKFEFDKYPQIVTNYMKSKNLEILDRHYIGKPGNLKLDNYQFDPTIVQPIQEEKCEICTKCQLMDATLQTPTNASEFEYMNDMPRHSEPQYAKETVVYTEPTTISPKNFIRQRKENTILVNITKCPRVDAEPSSKETTKSVREKVKNVFLFPFPRHSPLKSVVKKTGFDVSLLGGVSDHYVPDFILQGTMVPSKSLEPELIRDLELSTYLTKSLDSPIQAVAIVGDTSTWEVRVLGEDCAASGMSALVGDMLEVLSAMWRAKVPAKQCLSYIESKLREFCVLSKTLADMLMTTDFCDIATLTKSLNIDINDVPLLLAVATTHTPQIARRYGISYR